MTNLRKMMIGATALTFATLSTTPLMAGAQEVGGFFVGVNSQAIGVELDGSHTDNQSNITTGAVGQFAIIAGFEFGYSMPLGDTFALGIGMAVNPGAAKVSADNAKSSDVSFEISNHSTIWIEPSVAIGDNSAFYLKIGSSEADTKVSGDVNKPSDLSGNTYAIGTKTLLNENFYIKTEAGYTEYDGISVTGKGSSGGVSTGTTVKADPTIAFGGISLGVRF